MNRLLPMVGLALFCLQVSAGEVDFGINADAFRAVYTHEFTSNKLQLDGGWLHHTDNGDVAHVGLNLAGIASSGSDALIAGLGGRVVYQNGDRSKQSGWSVPIGGFLNFTPPRYNRITVGVAAYFAPSVLSIGDAEKYQDYTLRFAYNLMHQADVYLGARYVKGEYKNAPDSYYDTGMHIGFTLRF